MGTDLAKRPVSLVEQAFDMTVSPPSARGLQEELDALVATRTHLLPVEERARLQLAKRIDELDVDLRRSRFSERMLPLEPLGWRWSNGLPKLALLSLAGPNFNITASRNDEGDSYSSMNPGLPDQLARMYKDVTELARSYCVRKGSKRSFTYTFDGVIPASVRQSIADALKSHRFDELFMLVETPREAWRVETKKGMSRREEAREKAARLRFALANIDPLILGWAADSLWVIDKFDLTTLEQYVLDEFSQKALLPGS